ncbi:MAG: filamentous hemagglutinin N-terminal domain-containing protein, partial [Deltaproteobacteria bacterium]|nr:filamentous hemagglutinin N-terminal domain-containing protein [Deltaproteobacteria bacterium]
NLASTESATFSGAANLENVISRVTGGNPSSIDGLLRSTIPNADFFFINPAGVIFGLNAQIDIDGSFAVSTADFLTLADGGRFDAANPTNDSLTIAPPSAFGFVNFNPSSITLNGAILEVNSGESLTIVGGDISLDNSASLTAPGGDIQMVAVDSAGELPLDNLSTAAFTALGDIEILNNSSIDISSPLTTGSIMSKAETITMEGEMESTGGDISLIAD